MTEDALPLLIPLPLTSSPHPPHLTPSPPQPPPFSSPSCSSTRRPPGGWTSRPSRRTRRCGWSVTAWPPSTSAPASSSRPPARGFPTTTCSSPAAPSVRAVPGAVPSAAVVRRRRARLVDRSAAAGSTLAFSPPTGLVHVPALRASAHSRARTSRGLRADSSRHAEPTPLHPSQRASAARAPLTPRVPSSTPRPTRARWSWPTGGGCRPPRSSRSRASAARVPPACPTTPRGSCRSTSTVVSRAATASWRPGMSPTSRSSRAVLPPSRPTRRRTRSSPTSASPSFRGRSGRCCAGPVHRRRPRVPARPDARRRAGAPVLLVVVAAEQDRRAPSRAVPHDPRRGAARARGAPVRSRARGGRRARPPGGRTRPALGAEALPPG